jgi:hypothetical protein
MGFLGRAIGRRVKKKLDDFAQTPEGQAAIARRSRMMATVQTAQEIAGSGADDPTACVQLGEHLPEDLESPVRPIDPAVRGLFETEARLGRMSLTDAFAYLVALEPLPEQRRAAPGRKGAGWHREPSEARLVGAGTDRPHQIINTDLARVVVLEHLDVTRNGVAPTDDPTPFFERRRRAFTASLVLFGKRQARPRATN